MLQAIKNNIIVKPLKPKEFINGVLIPENHRKVQSLGHVIAVGSGAKSLKLNDFIYFPITSGHRFTYNDEDFIKFKEIEVYALIE